MSTIPIQFRWKIIEKWLTGLSDRIIANHLGISKSSVVRIRRRFQQFGMVQDFASLRGRPRLLTINDMKYLEVLLKERVDWYIWELQNEMEKWKSQTVGYSTIWRALHRLGYSHKQVQVYLQATFIFTVIITNKDIVYISVIKNCKGKKSK